MVNGFFCTNTYTAAIVVAHTNTSTNGAGIVSKGGSCIYHFKLALPLSFPFPYLFLVDIDFAR